MKMVRSLVFVWLALAGFGVRAQSVMQYLETWENEKLSDSVRFFALDEVAWYYSQTKPDSGYILAEQQIDFCEKVGREDWKYRALNNRSWSFSNSGNYSLGIADQFTILKAAERNKEPRRVASAEGNLGLMYQFMKQYDDALKFQQRAIKSNLALKDEDGVARAYNNIGLTYRDMKDDLNALKYFKLSMVLKTKLGDEKIMVVLYNNFFNSYSNLGQLDSAFFYGKKALEYANRFSNLQQKTTALINISTYYYDTKQYEQAYNYAQEGFQLSKQLQDRLYRKECLLHLAHVLEKLGRRQEAIDHYKGYVALQDSMFSEEAGLSALKNSMKYEMGKRLEQDSLKNAQEKEMTALENSQTLARQKIYTYASLAGFLLLVVIAFVSLRAYRQKKKDNHIIAEQKKLVEEKQTEIVDSINYAKRIQYTLLAHDQLLKENLPEHFVFFQPKDIVSGDFYWATRKVAGTQYPVAGSGTSNGTTNIPTKHPEQQDTGYREQDTAFYLAVCDSTGHGVPGAFMSLLNISFLNEAINEKHISDPAKVFDHVRQKLIENISQEGQKDGMDGILVKFESGHQQTEITYAAANNPLVVVRGKELIELPCDKMPIGKGESTAGFRSQTFQVQKGDLLYLYTDGYADQFGGPRGKKFKYSQLNQLLVEISGLSMAEQRKVLQQHFEAWQGELEQLDDVCIIGIKF